MNRNFRVSGGSSQFAVLPSRFSGISLRNFGLVGLLLAVVIGSAGALLHFGVHSPAAKASPTSSAKPNLSSISLPMFFEPNQGQTDPRVKFLARGSGYGLFLTADEAVLELQHSAISTQHSVAGSRLAPDASVLEARSSKLEAPVTSIIRMHLDGANPSATIAGAELLPGKSEYYIGNDPAKWRRNIPQYARVNYQSVYPGVDLVYYGNQGQLEYDFRVAPGADPSRIALKFEGASARLDNGDLVLSTRAGDVRFHAPNIYQQDRGNKRAIKGAFRQLANNEIGFQIGDYDRSRELVIDPTLFYSTYLGGTGGAESNVHVAVDQGFNVYVAGSTTSPNFPLVTPIQSSLNGAQNLFIAKLNPAATGAAQLLLSTYLGGNGSDTAAGVGVDTGGSIYVAGTTTSTDFPTTPNAFQGTATENPSVAHGFISKISLLLSTYSLSYSSYLSGNGTDTVTGLAIDNSGNAFVTGTTTSTDAVANGFPASATGFQTASGGGTSQFFASKINTAGNGFGSMAYSTYFGGGNPTTATTVGGGIAIDSTGNMYFTGASNFQGVGSFAFPLLNAQQICLNEPGKNASCTNPAPSNLDAFVAKINPNIVGVGGLVYSTFLGGSDNDVGLAVGVDTSDNSYVTGETFSVDWNNPSPTLSFQPNPGTGGDAFIAKLGPLNLGIYPLAYFTYLGGSGEDIGRAIVADSTSTAHVTGSTTSSSFPIVTGTLQGYAGNTDAFVGLITSTGAAGSYLTWLGGSAFDEGTGIAIDTFNGTYVAGDTQSGNFPTVNPYQAGLAGTRDAFVSKITNSSSFVYAANSPSVSPNPGNMGNQETFTFTWTNNGPEAANNVVFSGTLTGTALGQGFSFGNATASPGGACPTQVGGVLTCTIGTVAANGDATVTVVLTPTPVTPCTPPSVCPSSLTVAPSLSFNGGPFTLFAAASVPVDDFTVTASPSTQPVTAGGSVSYTVSLAPIGSGAGYADQISMSVTILPATSTITTSFTTNPVTISGSSTATTTLNVTTQPRPVGSSSLWPRGPIYATWIPVSGLSLLGLGVGASRRRRRWILGGLVGLIAAIVLLQPACGNSNSAPASTGGTPAGTYTITITGASGSASHQATPVQLVVN